MIHRIGREAAYFAFFLLLTIVMTWPLARDLQTAVSDPGDPLINAWIIDWVSFALTHAPLQLFDGPLFYPAEKTLAFSENLIGVSLLMLPFQLAGVPPVAVYNIAMLVGFAFSGYGAFVLARLVTGSVAPALLAGAFFAFVPFKFDHLSHLQIIWSGWLPLLLAALFVYWRTPSLRNAALITGAFVMNGLTNIHYLLFGGVAVVVAILVMAIAEGRSGRRFWLMLAGSLLVAGALLLPVLLPYRYVSQKYGMKRPSWEVMGGSPTIAGWLVATPRSATYGRLGAPELHGHEAQFFPGVFAIALALAGALLTRREILRGPPDTIDAPRALRTLDVCIAIASVFVYVGITTGAPADVSSVVLLALVVTRLTLRYPNALGGNEGYALRGIAARTRFPAEAWVGVVLMVFGVLASLGMRTFVHGFLHRRLEPFQAIRAPGRWAIIVYVGLAIWVAIGGMAILRRYEGRRAHYATALLLALLLIDLRPLIRWEHVDPTVAPVYRWLDHQKPGPVVELPISGGGAEFQYLLGSTVHRMPAFNGASGFETPLHRELRTLDAEGKYDDAFLSLLEENGARVVVVHVHAMPERSWLPPLLSSGRLAFLTSFDHAVGGDYVFAVTKNFPGWQSLRAVETPDGAGHLPQQKLARMLAGQAVHSDAIMAVVELPQSYSTVKGPLHIQGWALSPFGTRDAQILFDGGSVRIPARRVERPDVKRHYSWYYYDGTPGFEATLPARPPGIRRDTLFQVEITDHAGRKMRTGDVLLRWE